MALLEMEAGPLAVPLDVVKAYLRVQAGDEDAVIERLVRGAGGLCERFIGQALIIREGAEVVAGCGEWRRLSTGPVRSIEGVVGLDGAGMETALATEACGIDIDANGDGWVRLSASAGVGRARVTFSAGLAADAAGVPEAIAQGIVRLVAGQYVARDGGDGPLPAAVTALWRPWRRMRLA